MVSRKSKRLIIWILALVLIGFGIVWASGYFQIINHSTTSKLKIIDNPYEYVYQNITLKNVGLCSSHELYVYREDGSFARLEMSYLTQLNHYYHYNLYGHIGYRSNNGLVDLDNNGVPLKEQFIFIVEKAVQVGEYTDVFCYP